jgi:hypothetical protein
LEDKLRRVSEQFDAVSNEREDYAMQIQILQARLEQVRIGLSLSLSVRGLMYWAGVGDYRP